MYEFNFDRYHAVMGNFYLGKNSTLPDKKSLGEKKATFYLTHRKGGYGPIIGHSRLLQSMVGSQINEPHARFLREDRANLSLLADRLIAEGSVLGKIDLVKEGTIMFAGEPFCYFSGRLWSIQLAEVRFEHSFDLPITVGGNAMRMREAAGKETFLSVFSLRRDGDQNRSIRVSEAAYISGFNDTSDMEAAFSLGIPDVGTMAHYLVQSFGAYPKNPKKHFEQIAFERWLDANPKGTVLLIDTFDYKTGLIHAIKAAQSSKKRMTAFKGIRIDSGDLAEEAKFCRETLDRNGFEKVGIILTGDLDEKKIQAIRTSLPFPIKGYGVGTKLAAETTVAGVIFKMCEIDGMPIMKISNNAAKTTLPGELQVWRCIGSDGMYVKDMISLKKEPMPRGRNFAEAIPLINPFWGLNTPIYQSKSPQSLKAFVSEQLERFPVPLSEYSIGRSQSLKKVIEEVKNNVVMPIGD